MSGGSYDYLYSKEPFEDYGINSQLQSMESEMRSKGYGEIADELYKYRLERETSSAHLRIMHRRLENVMQSFEWWESGDSGKDNFDAAVNKFIKG